MIEFLRVLGSRLLGAIWRALRIPPLQGQQPDDEPDVTDPMYPSQMRDDVDEDRPPPGQ